MFRTPVKQTTDLSPTTTPPKLAPKSSAFRTQTKVRRETEGREAGKVLFPEETSVALIQPSKLREARAWVTKAKMALNASRNLKTDIKASVIQAIDGLYQLIKETDSENPVCSPLPAPCGVDGNKGDSRPREEERVVDQTGVTQLLSSIAEHSKLMKESNEKAEQLKEALRVKEESREAATYASVAAGAKGRKRPDPTALHSVVVASRNDMDTGEEVLGKIRTAVKSKEGEIKIDRIRKAKDRKIVISCRTEEERNRVQTRLEAADQQLEVLVVKNQDPLIILRDVLSSHKDEEILEFLRMQNKNLFRDLPTGDDRAEIRFRKRAGNTLMCHAVLKVSPILWHRFLEASEVYLDLQLIRAEDHSPLVQCSMCLGYGHTRRLCTETEEKCGHCGGPHHRRECADKLASAQPTCCNCAKANLETTGHGAFSMECPVRRKWEALARAKIAYC